MMNTQHLAAWKNHVDSIRSEFGETKLPTNIFGWRRISYHRTGTELVKCPMCPFATNPYSDLSAFPHPEIFENSEELYRHQGEILQAFDVSDAVHINNALRQSGHRST
jgi:hypothetical protein